LLGHYLERYNTCDQKGSSVHDFRFPWQPHGVYQRCRHAAEPDTSLLLFRKRAGTRASAIRRWRSDQRRGTKLAARRTADRPITKDRYYPWSTIVFTSVAVASSPHRHFIGRRISGAGAYTCARLNFPARTCGERLVSPASRACGRAGRSTSTLFDRPGN
jgi:hypothetical protein